MPSPVRHDVCRICAVPLDASNLYPSNLRRRDWICKTRVIEGERGFGTRRTRTRSGDTTRNTAMSIAQRYECTQFREKYGVTQEIWDEFMRRQDQRCYLCGGRFSEGNNTRPEIDHAHSTGEVGGIVHGGCNRIIGMVNEDPEVLQRIATSLRRCLGGVQVWLL